jgi:hypothetical protein
MPEPIVALDPTQSWQLVGASAMRRPREGRPRWCIVRITLQPPYFTLCRSQRAVRTSALLLSVRPEAICRECIILAMRRADLLLRRELLNLHHHQQGATP